MLILPKLVYCFNTIPIKTSTNYSVDFNKQNLNFIWKGKRPRIANIILKNEVGRHYLVCTLTIKPH